MDDRMFDQRCFFSSSPFQNWFWALCVEGLSGCNRGSCPGLCSNMAGGESFPIRSRKERLVQAPGNHPDVVGNEIHSASYGGVFGRLVLRSCGRCQKIVFLLFRTCSVQIVVVGWLIVSISFSIVVALVGLSLFVPVLGLVQFWAL